MMRPKSITITAAGTSQAVPLDRYTNGYAVAVVKNYDPYIQFTLQHTFTDPGSTNLNSAGAGIWFNHDESAMVNATGNVNSNYAYPPRASRVVVASAAASASITVTYVPRGAI
jgi:hypothetical protein